MKTIFEGVISDAWQVKSRVKLEFLAFSGITQFENKCTYIDMTVWYPFKNNDSIIIK